MTRREFIALLGGAAAAWPVAARAQQSDRMRRLGVLMGFAEEDHEAQARIAGFKQALEELGWTNGRNIEFNYRWTLGDADRMRVYARELVQLAPDVILSATTLALASTRQETGTVPIVFVNVTDPVGSGLVANLSRPGGDITGFSNFEPSMGGKWVQLLKELAPRVTRIALVSNPEVEPQTRSYASSIEAAAASLAMKPIAAPIHDSAEIENAIATLAREPGTGLIVLSGLFTFSHRKLIAELADRYGVPAVYPYREFVQSGGLLSYGIDQATQFRQAAPYVDRILRGEKPGGDERRDHAGIERIVLRQNSTGPGELPQLERIDLAHGHASREQRPHGTTLVATARLDADSRDREAAQLLDQLGPSGGVVRHRRALLLRQHHDVQPILRHIDTAKRKHCHLRIPFLLMRARAPATVRVWKKRPELQAHSRFAIRNACGLPVATGRRS
jgi:ABC-type uncharacterized transport system substrate-binding protein